MSDDASDLELSLPARAENVAVVRHVLGGVGDVLGLDPEVLDDIRLAVSEACANVVVHAYPDSDGLLVVRVFTYDDVVAVAVRDHGSGMAPRADSPGLGVGLPLIASLTRTLELSAPSGGGTEVRMAFDLQPRSLTGDESHQGNGEAELGS
ncbi:MAG TPA: ATP-binding protein [Solirubrobacteraceae bacterium]